LGARDGNERDQGLSEDRVNGFFQRPQFNAFERLICGHLIEAGKTDQPLQSVIHITRASLAIEDDKAKALDIDKKHNLILYTTAQRLGTAVKTVDKWGKTTYGVSLNTVKLEDIKHWRIPKYYGWATDQKNAEKIREYERKNMDEELFRITSQNLNELGYVNMVSDFLFYCTPLMEELSRKLSTLVSPETYTELMRLYHGEKT
jgi:hypothetical protein